jgi:hypothetical protein
MSEMSISEKIDIVTIFVTAYAILILAAFICITILFAITIICDFITQYYER